MDGRFDTGIEEHDIEEVTLVARGIATAAGRASARTRVSTPVPQATTRTSPSCTSLVRVARSSA